MNHTCTFGTGARHLVAMVVAFVVLHSLAFAQSGVTVTLFQPPPNQLKIADFWRIRLTNSSNTTYTVCLFGTLDETNIGKRLVDATTARFTLPPGTKLVTGADIQPIDAEYYDNKYKDVFLRTGSAPAGEYRICVEVRLECGDQVLATDCKQQVVQPVTPPILISPPNGSTVEEPLPVFSWMPPSPLKAGQRPAYTLKIVEVLGRQTAYDAMQSNPAWFERTRIAPTVFQYPISSRKFTTGAHYAWKVVATDGAFPLGESEIWEFTYIPRKLSDGFDGDRGGDTIIPLKGSNPGLNPAGFTPNVPKTKTFLDPKGHQRGVVMVDIGERQVTPGLLTPLLVDEIHQKIKPAIPSALLEELLRSCNGD